MGILLNTSESLVPVPVQLHLHQWQRCPDLMDRYEAWQLLPSVSAHSAPHPLISLFCLWFPPDWLSVDETRNEMDELHGSTSAFWLSSGGELSEPGDIVEISPWIWKQKQIAGNVSPEISFSKISFSLSNWENVAWILMIYFKLAFFPFSAAEIWITDWESGLIPIFGVTSWLWELGMLVQAESCFQSSTTIQTNWGKLSPTRMNWRSDSLHYKADHSARY